MFVDARAVGETRSFAADVAVVGGGAAGLSLAVALEAHGLDVVLIESGGFAPEAATQALYAAASTGAPYPVPTCRLRQYGGTLNHWGGTTRPLDAFEFERHDWVPHSGWPIGAADLAPYYPRAAAVLDVPRADFAFDPAERDSQGLPPLLGDSGDFAPVVWRRTQPGATRVGDKYRDAIAESRRIRCLLHANATQLVTDGESRTVETLRLGVLGGGELRVRARHVVLAAGAIENARLLLDSGGLGNAHDQVGRCFADHGFHLLGWVLVTHPGSWLREERFMRALPAPGLRRDDTGFAATPAFRRRRKSLGFSMIAGPFDPVDEAGPGAAGVRELTRGPDGQRVRRPKTAPGDVPQSDTRWMGLLAVVEQSPNPQSRITLGHERNALGARNAVIHHALQEADWRSLRTSAEAFGVAVAKAGHSRVRLAGIDGQRWIQGGGGHHSGTTRMSDDPKRGVTDRHGRVHGVANLWVAGSSLFPTAGWAHPTLSVVALSLRQADRLAEVQKS
ncbi:MAG: FAD-dependent oxidoreductase [Myxococcota bacterium]